MKFLAVLLGTYGIGISSQLLNLNYFIIFIGTVGFPVGLTKYISEWDKEGKWENILLSIKQVLFILFLVGVIGIIMSFIFAKELSVLLLDSKEFSWLIFIVFCSFPFTAISSVFDSLVKGIKRFGLSVKASITTSIITFIITIIFVYYYNIMGVALGLLISSICGVVIYYYFLLKEKIWNYKNLLNIKSEKNPVLKNILKIGIASLLVGGLNQLVQLIIRSYIIRKIGVDYNGIYQGVYAISNNYFNIFFMTISIYSLPVLSEMKEKDMVNLELNNLLRITLLIIVPIIMFAFTLRYYIILLLYTEKFIPATDYMAFNFLGDFFKALAWVFGAWLIPATKIKMWAIIDFIFDFNYLFLFFILITFFNLHLYSVVIAYFIAFIIHAIISLIVLVKYNKFTFSKINIKSIISSIISLIILILISNYNLIFGYLFVFPILLIWFKLNVTNKEVKQMLSFVLNKINFFFKRIK